MFLSNLSKVNLRRSIEEAMKISDWREAVFEEMKALKKNGTWEIFSLQKVLYLWDANGFLL